MVEILDLMPAVYGLLINENVCLYFLAKYIYYYECVQHALKHALFK